MEPEEYSELIAGIAPTPETETIRLAESPGRTVAEDVIADVAIPAFATSAMDGFALDSDALNTLESGAAVRVSGDLPAGSQRIEIVPGTAVRVMTGAQVPTTAEAVVPVEYTDASRTGPAPDAIRASGLTMDIRPGWNIRSVGEDTARGETVLAAGSRISAAGVGTLAMLGRETITVVSPWTGGLLVTGDELRTDDELRRERELSSDDEVDLDDTGPLIHNSNLPMLVAAFEGLGAVVIQRSCPDDPNRLLAVLDELTDRVDLVITTGGISAGAHEVVRQALEGGHSTFRRLALRPGGPQGHGTYRDTPMLHFPGTPAGALLSFQLFATSLLDGRRLGERWRRAVFSGPEIIGHHRSISVMPARFTSTGEVETLGRARLRDFANAEVIIRIPRAPEAVRSGDVIAVLEC